MIAPKKKRKRVLPKTCAKCGVAYYSLFKHLHRCPGAAATIQDFNKKLRGDSFCHFGKRTDVRGWKMSRRKRKPVHPKTCAKCGMKYYGFFTHLDRCPGAASTFDEMKSLIQNAVRTKRVRRRRKK